MDYNYNSAYDYPTAGTAENVDPATAAAAAIITFSFIFVFVVVGYVINSFLLGRIFKKAGVPQWIAWVPIYSNWKTLELGNQQGFWSVLALIPFVGIISAIFTIIAMFHIGKKLGKDDWFVLLAIFLPVVWMIWLGFDDSKWPAAEKAKLEKASAKKAA